MQRLSALLALLSSLMISSANAQSPARLVKPTEMQIEHLPDRSAYPYPVSFLQFETRAHHVSMAFMDVPAKSPETGVVVLFHGKNFASNYWAPVLDGLTAAGLRVIAIDQIGFGQSSKPEIDYSFDLLASHTIMLLDALNLERVHVIGNSMGGMLAIRFASLNPRRVRSLVLENPIGLEDYSKATQPRRRQSLCASRWRRHPRAIAGS